jgi:hypothetical protein
MCINEMFLSFRMPCQGLVKKQPEDALSVTLHMLSAAFPALAAEIQQMAQMARCHQFLPRLLTH